jgi:hypothetical protein
MNGLVHCTVTVSFFVVGPALSGISATLENDRAGHQTTANFQFLLALTQRRKMHRNVHARRYFQ